MQSGLFKNVKTQDDLNNLLALLKSYCAEHFIDMSDCVKLTNVEFKNAFYAMSSSVNGIVYRNYFLYEAEDSDLIGLCYIPCESDKCINLIDPLYEQFSVVHNQFIFAHNKDGTLDIYISGHKVLDGILNCGIYEICSHFKYIAINLGDCFSLVFVDMREPDKGVYFIENQLEFTSSFMTILLKDGVEGYLDGMPVSEIMKQYHRIKHAVFKQNNYKSIIDLVTK